MDAEPGKCAQQVRIAAHVIEMVVRRQDGDEPHAAPPDLVQHRRRLRAIDDGGVPGLPVDEQIGVVVAQLRDGDDLHALG